jgi:hypothetical protein
MISNELKSLNAVDQATAELRERNAIRLQEAKDKLGKKYLLHPDNAMSREKFQKIAKVTS